MPYSGALSSGWATAGHAIQRPRVRARRITDTNWQLDVTNPNNVDVTLTQLDWPGGRTAVNLTIPAGDSRSVFIKR